MKYRWIALVLMCALLSGCVRVFDGHYTSVKPHTEQNASGVTQKVSAENYTQLYAVLTAFVESGQAEGVINVDQYDPDRVRSDMSRAVSEIRRRNPIAAYAVEQIDFEFGKSGGQTALAVNIEFTHSRAEILKIKQVRGMDNAMKLVRTALNQCEPALVMLIREYEELDFIQAVESYALEYPQVVMEQPYVTVNTFPQTGVNRVVELRFTYQTSRDALRNMQAQVEPVFESAMLYVRGDAAEKEKYSQLYSFLMERYDYQITGSITPAYSLLRYGVGDSRAFASVYAAMCRQVGLECMVVSGTRNAESWCWNIICDEGIYYHVNLLDGSFRERTDAQMTGFVWDYSTYPPCGIQPQNENE